MIGSAHWHGHGSAGAGWAGVLLALLISFGMSSGGKAPVYAGGPWYVAPTGAAANDCRTPATACRTIGAAIQKAASGETIYIAAGTYNETLTLPRSLRLEGASASN